MAVAVLVLMFEACKSDICVSAKLTILAVHPDSDQLISTPSFLMIQAYSCNYIRIVSTTHKEVPLHKTGVVIADPRSWAASQIATSLPVHHSLV